MPYFRAFVTHARIFGSGSGFALRRFSSSSQEPLICREIVTLDPTRMAELGQRLINPCNLTKLTIRFPLLHANHQYQTSFGDPMPISHRRIESAIRYKKLPVTKEFPTNRYLKFPESAKGVLYFHRCDPILSSSIRFRICEDATPSSFDLGYDLKVPPTDYGEEHTWEMPLFAVALTETYRPLLQTLLNDGLVHQSVIEPLRDIDLESPAHVQNLLFSIDQPFVMDLSQTAKLGFLTAKGYSGKIQFRFFACKRALIYPFSGKVRVRLVLSDRPEHRKNPSLLLQYLDILTPVTRVHETDIIKMPVVGEYLQRSGKLWSFWLKRSDVGRRIAQTFDIPL
ncbi:hypothetical protein CPC08DRAFT_709241 [Agrocybe pediades]|nr:hypothetical protein CPC08DRAFT_709241 [Agrocybe pediades]